MLLLPAIRLPAAVVGISGRISGADHVLCCGVDCLFGGDGLVGCAHTPVTALVCSVRQWQHHMAHGAAFPPVEQGIGGCYGACSPAAAHMPHGDTMLID